MTNEQGLVERCRKPGCGALAIIGKPCTDYDCPQQDVPAHVHVAALEAQAAENAELRAEVERLRDRAGESRIALIDELNAEHARVLAAETALAVAREALSEIYNAPVPDSFSHARPEIGWPGFPGFKVIAQRALKTKEPSHG